MNEAAIRRIDEIVEILEDFQLPEELRTEDND